MTERKVIKLDNPAPKYAHDCAQCKFLATYHDSGWGTLGFADTYVCIGARHNAPNGRVIVQRLDTGDNMTVVAPMSASGQMDDEIMRAATRIALQDHKPLIGKRVEIPVHYDLWMRGARMGTVTQYRNGKDGQSDCLLVKMDHPQVRRRVKLWRPDWEYAKFDAQGRD
jgi:hypothetical protein